MGSISGAPPSRPRRSATTPHPATLWRDRCQKRPRQARPIRHRCPAARRLPHRPGWAMNRPMTKGGNGVSNVLCMEGRPNSSVNPPVFDHGWRRPSPGAPAVRTWTA